MKLLSLITALTINTACVAQPVNLGELVRQQNFALSTMPFPKNYDPEDQYVLHKETQRVKEYIGCFTSEETANPVRITILILPYVPSKKDRNKEFSAWQKEHTSVAELWGMNTYVLIGNAPNDSVHKDGVWKLSDADRKDDAVIKDFVKEMQQLFDLERLR